MKRLTNKKEADAQRREYENRLKNGYPRNIPEERFLKLAAYEDTDLDPETLNEFAPFLLEMKMNIGAMRRLKELVQAEKDGRLVVLESATKEGAEKRNI